MVWESVANSSARKVTWSTTSGSNPQPSSHATLKAGAVRELRKDCRDAVCLSTNKQTPRYAKKEARLGLKPVVPRSSRGRGFYFRLDFWECMMAASTLVEAVYPEILARKQ